jgi:hypothetical protein
VFSGFEYIKKGTYAVLFKGLDDMIIVAGVEV